ncbi:hypothetical protein M8J76_004704 [Diaphorina citri]|nr:hypothetical protein M8J76_004704 [Diaphorina citri]
MGHQPLCTMNPPPGAGKTTASSNNRSSGYHQMALAEIRNSLLPFAHTGENGLGGSSAASTISTLSTTSGVSSVSSSLSNGVDKDLNSLRQALNQLIAMGYSEDLNSLRQALNQLIAMGYSEDMSLKALKMADGRYDAALNFLLKQGDLGKLSPGLSKQLIRKPSLERGSPVLDSGAASSRSDSPRQILDLTHPQLSRQYSPSSFSEPPPPPPPRTSSTPPPPPPLHVYPPNMQQMLKRLSPAPVLPQRGAQEPPPPYPSPAAAPPPPPSYSASIQSRQSPTQSPSSGIYSGPGSTGSPSPIPPTRPAPLQAWSSRQAKTQPVVIMQSVKSTPVQKPSLQTAIAPTSPPSYSSSIQQQQKPQPPSPVPTTEPPSYASTMQALATSRVATISIPESNTTTTTTPAHPLLQRKFSPGDSRSESPASASSTESRTPPLPPTTSSSVNNKNMTNGTGGGRTYKINHQSPIPERKHMTKEKEDERRECKVKNYSPQAFKFFMEQHIENVIKSHKQRVFRRLQLETEMAKIGLSAEAQCQMRKMLSQKESNYIRLKRAKMDKSMFIKIKPIGVGAFGEVTLVRKIDTNHLYAMKTLRKADVLKRNQVAHVKAERDILAEADNEWVVKLYYSFQDKDNLYFVMDYIPGGDLMSLLIKKGIFEEPLARFYIAELTCAVESVHKMGFIHRDIKPDNILIDRDGHIKLTDFGLCTGFRWTHNSKYYQSNGDHGRQDSMEPSEEWSQGTPGQECRCINSPLKPLERRRRREHQRCLAHSLVGTPNYIAPEVLLRTGYTQLCDWWSVGVILYEMLVGSPPFLANTSAETQYKVINWESCLHIPAEAQLSPEGADLILQLCTGADKRLGKNASEVKAHPFFSNVDFEKGVRTLTPPHIPRIQNSMDTSNFDPVDPDKLRNSDSMLDELSDELKSPFHGFFEFTFRRFFDDGGGVPYPNKISLDDNETQGAVYV